MNVLGVVSVLKDEMMVAAQARTDLHHFARAVLGTSVHNDHTTMSSFLNQIMACMSQSVKSTCYLQTHTATWLIRCDTTAMTAN